MTYPPEDDRRYAWAEYGRIVKRSWDSRNPLLTAALKLFRAAPLNQVSGVGRGDGQPDNSDRVRIKLADGMVVLLWASLVRSSAVQESS
jgi:hypothetical protein